MQEYKICNYCVMDNSSDDTITFDDSGQCNYCKTQLSRKKFVYFPNEEGGRRLQSLIAKLKEENKDKEYDCLMGISGGLDSSYLAYLGTTWGLRILAIHVDDGFDTQISTENLKKLNSKTNLDIITIRPDAEQFNDLSRAFFLAGVPNLAMPQDNIIFACLYQYAKEKKIRSFLSGGNFALECILQKGNTHDAYDKVNILDIHKKFGRKPIDKLPLLTNFQRDWDKRVLKIETLRPLNYIDYNRDRAFAELKEFCGFEYYGSKHLENIFTKFLQVYYLYNKFHVDKRRSHFSSMIVSGQMTRDQALAELEKPYCNNTEMQNDIEFIIKKLDLTRAEFDRVMAEPPKQHTEYKTSLYNKFRSIIQKKTDAK